MSTYNITNIFPVNLLLFAVVVFSYLPFEGFIPAYIRPNFLIHFIFFFSISENNKPSLPFLIALGLFEDMLSNSIIGLSSLIYIVVQMLASSNQKALVEQKFIIVWISFAIALISSSIIKIYFLKLYYQIDGVYTQTLISIYFGILVYPTIHYLLYRKFLST